MPERGADPTNVEVEWQLDALDLRPVERWLGTFPRVVAGGAEGSSVVVSVDPQPVKRTVDVYLDTPDWRIGRSGFVLRIRHLGDQGEVTLKDTTPAVAGLRRRIEVSEPLPPSGLDALDPEGPVGRRLRALAGDAPLVHLLEIRTRRRPHLLCAADVALAEIDLDDTIIVIGDDQYPVRIRRVEVEADPQWVDLLTPLVDQLRIEGGLQPAILSKFEAGLLAAGLHVPKIPDLGPTTLGADPTVGDVAYCVLRRNLSSMLTHEAGTRLGEDIEELHDMRVATRRLRAALTLFSGVLPAHADRLRQEIGWLADELGAVRDIDVQLERLDTWRHELPDEDSGALTDLARLLRAEREVARRSMLTALDSHRYDRLVTEFTAILRPGPHQGSGRHIEAAAAPALAVVPGLILARHRSVAAAARRARRTSQPADYHRLRIRSKRLRYALEFVSEIYDGRTRGVVRRVVRLQDCLGLIQDADVAATRLHTLATDDASALSPATIFAMGSVAERYRTDAARLAGTLPGHLDAIRDDRWRKFKALMNRRRLEAGPSRTWSSRPSEPTDPPVDDRTGRPGPLDLPPTWPRSSSSPFPSAEPTSFHPDAEPDEETDWDDDDGPTLRSVPGRPDPTPPDHTGRRPPARSSDGPAVPPPAPVTETSGVRRRKEPVFLPASPSPVRPGPVRPTPKGDSPDADRSRSSHDPL